MIMGSNKGENKRFLTACSKCKNYNADCLLRTFLLQFEVIQSIPCVTYISSSSHVFSYFSFVTHKTYIAYYII